MNPEVPLASLRALAGLLRKDVCWLDARMTNSALTVPRLKAHISGEGPRVGLAQIKAGESVAHVGLLDFDSHQGETPFDEMLATAGRVVDNLRTKGGEPLLFRSSGGKGLHLYVLWEEPQDVYSVREYLRGALRACDLKSGTKGVSKGEVEVFPKQDFVPADGFGNMAVLPYAGQSCQLDLSDSCADRPLDTPLVWQWSQPVIKLQKPPREMVITQPSVELADFRKALEAIPNETEPVDYDEWRNIIFSIHFATEGSDEGLAMAHEFSARSGKYDPEFLDNRVWPYIVDEKEGGITDRYVIAKAGEYGFNGCEASDFDLDDDDGRPPEAKPVKTEKGRRFAPIHSAIFSAEIPDTHWLVKDLIPLGGLVVTYGASGSGKTFAVLDIAEAVARGVPWRGLKTHRGRVVYVAAEGAVGFRRRLRAYALHNGLKPEDIDLFVIPAAPSLLEIKDVKELIEELKQLGDIRLVILDTLAQVTAGGNENSGEDMGKALRHANLIGQALNGATVLLVHHTGKDEARGARGWSGIKGALDTEMEVVSDGNDRAITITKQKDGEGGQSYGFELEEVLLGFNDEDGEEMRSCVVREKHTSSRSIQKRKKLGENETLVRDAILAASIDSSGLVDPDEIIEELVAATGKRRASFQRAGHNLIEAGIIRLANGRWQDINWSIEAIA